jgi:hypothetical protein
MNKIEQSPELGRLKSFLDSNREWPFRDDRTKADYDVKEKIAYARATRESQYLKCNEENGYLHQKYNYSYIIERALIQHTDLDTKNFIITPTMGAYRSQAELIKLAFRNAMKQEGYDEFMNEVAEVTATDGSAYIKMVGSKPYIVDPFNLVISMNAQSLQSTDIAELLELDVIEAEKKYDLEAAKDLIKLYKEAGIYNIPMVEYYTMVNIGGNIKRGVIVCIDMTALKDASRGYFTTFCNTWGLDNRSANYLEVYKEHLVENDGEFPYLMTKMFSTRGRLHGVGIYEKLFPFQQKLDELWNGFHKLVQSRFRGVWKHVKAQNMESAITQDVIDQMDTGAIIEVIQGKEDFLPLNQGDSIIGEINSLLSLINNIVEMMRDTIGVSELATGKVLPSSTTATTARVSHVNSETALDHFQEKQGIFHKNLVTFWMLPSILKKMSREDVTRITGSTQILQEIDYELTRTMLANMLADGTDSAIQREFHQKFGRFIYTNDIEQLVQAKVDEMRRSGKHRYAEIREELIDNIPFIVDIDITGEANETQAQVQNLKELLALPILSEVGKVENILQALLTRMNLPEEDLIKSSMEIAKDKADKRQEAIQNMQAQAQAQQQSKAAPGIPSAQGDQGFNNQPGGDIPNVQGFTPLQ